MEITIREYSFEYYIQQSRDYTSWYKSESCWNCEPKIKTRKTNFIKEIVLRVCKKLSGKSGENGTTVVSTGKKQIA